MADKELPQPDQLIENLLANMGKYGASDLHLKVGYAPVYRVGGNLRKIEMPPMPNTDFIRAMMDHLLPPGRIEEFERQGDLDFSFSKKGGDRYRINIFRSGSEMHAAIRRVESRIPDFASLNLPPVYQKICDKAGDGLVLVSGVTGCGKSSTLAAMVNHMNKIRYGHIITIEDPVEFKFTPDKCIISQREIGIDVPNFRDALRYAVRQDPDIILIGELRDRDTMMAALQASETGHLVFGSLHCSDAQQAFSRILEFFPREEHGFIRSSIANSFKAICVQRLLPCIDPDKRTPATEVLLNNSLVRDKIRNEEDQDIPAIINQSLSDGMRSFTESLAELIEQEKIHYDTALQYAPNREQLASRVKGIQTSSRGLL